MQEFITFFAANGIAQNNLNRPRGKESTEVRKSQIKGKESDAVFVVCSQTFTLFQLRKTAMPVEISRYSFRVFVGACPFVISSIPFP